MKRTLLTLIIAIFLTTNIYGQKIYSFANTFSISVSNKLELRKKGDAYKGPYYDNFIVFQQSGLGANKSKAFNLYCRIMILIDNDYKKNELLNVNDKTALSKEDLKYFYDFADSQLGKGIVQQFVGKVNTCWTKVNGYNAVKTHYVRTGTKAYGNADVSIYHLYNNDKYVIIITSYSVAQKNIWQNVISNTINSFTWKYPKYSKKR